MSEEQASSECRGLLHPCHTCGGSFYCRLSRLAQNPSNHNAIIPRPIGTAHITIVHRIRSPLSNLHRVRLSRMSPEHLLTSRYLFLWSCVVLHLSFVPSVSSLTIMLSTTAMRPQHVVRIAEPVWRAAVAEHVHEMRSLLQPGLTPPDHFMNSGRLRGGQLRAPGMEWCTALDPQHPVYNFLIEYYGLKGIKGPKRLARWSPNPALVFQQEERITSLDQLKMVEQSDTISRIQQEKRTGGILLEGATENDISGVLHLRGSLPAKDGILYSPASFVSQSSEDAAKAATPYLWYRSVLFSTLNAEPILHCHVGHAIPSTWCSSSCQCQVSISFTIAGIPRNNQSGCRETWHFLHTCGRPAVLCSGSRTAQSPRRLPGAYRSVAIGTTGVRPRAHGLAQNNLAIAAIRESHIATACIGCGSAVATIRCRGQSIRCDRIWS